MSMLCQHCKQAKATVHITDTLPEKRELHLCEDCAEKEGVIIKHSQPTTNAILQEFIKHKTAGGSSSADDYACPECGLTFREFRTKGQLGCPNDYEVFREPLKSLIKRAHDGAVQHIGKVPQNAGSTVKRQTESLRLQRALQDAIEQENYELAAQIRDKIRLLDSGESA